MTHTTGLGCMCPVHSISTATFGTVTSGGWAPTPVSGWIPGSSPCVCHCNHVNDVLKLLSHVYNMELPEIQRRFSGTSGGLTLPDISARLTTVESSVEAHKTRPHPIPLPKQQDREVGKHLSVSVSELTPFDVGSDIECELAEALNGVSVIYGRLMTLYTSADQYRYVSIQIEQVSGDTVSSTLNFDHPVRIFPVGYFNDERHRAEMPI